MNAINNIAQNAMPQVSDETKAMIRAQYEPGVVGYRTLARMFGLCKEEIQEIIHGKKIVSKSASLEKDNNSSPERMEAAQVISTNYLLERSNLLVGKKLWHFRMRLWQRYEFELSHIECIDIVEGLKKNEARPISISGDRTYYAVEHPNYKKGPIFILACNYTQALTTAADPTRFIQLSDGNWIMRKNNHKKVYRPDPSTRGLVHAHTPTTLKAA